MPGGLDLTGKTALVTGGAGSVGRHITRQLAESGATVLIGSFHSYEAAKDLATELTAAGHRAAAVRGSVAKLAQVERVFAEIAGEYDRLDILVNNAAAGVFTGLDDITEEHLDRAFATNVKGALWCARAARPLMARAGGGAIVNVSSIGARYAPANYLSVGISKAALESLTRYLAAEFAIDGIRVNAASAGLIDNEVGRMFPEFDSVRANTVNGTPLGRLATEADLADLVTFLAGPAARWMTGQTVVADGGLGLLHRAMSPDLAPAVTVTAQADPEPNAQAADPEPNAQAAEPSAQAADPAPLLAPDEDPVVVVGMGLAVPGASDCDTFWSLLTEGAELFTEVPAERWSVDGFYHPDPGAPDKTYQRKSGFMTGFTPHPALARELPSLGKNLDHTAVWLRHSVHQALDGVRRRPADRFDVALGYTPDGSQHLQESLVRREVRHFAAEHDVDPGDPELGALLDRCLPLGDDALPPHRLGLLAVQGLVPEETKVSMLDTACSSSLYAIDLGVRALMAGAADIAICGGAFALAPAGSVLFSKLHGLSRRGDVRALDKDADGVLFSDGAGIVVLKRLSRALADGDRIHGVISGIGLSADGKGKAIYAPSSGGQELAVRRALAKSGVRADQVDWVIAHATGTPAGDEAEITGLSAAYAGDHPVRVTSNKSLVGHTGWAAGVVSVIHALLALRNGVIPAQYRFTEASPHVHLDTSNLTVPTEPVTWPARPDRPRTAAVSGFGFGGTNAHVLLQDHRPELRPIFGYGERRPEPVVLVGWSAHLPGCDDPAAVERWAREQSSVPASFGAAYPPPPFQKLRMPASAVRATDRSQLMIVECMQRLDPAVRAACDRNRAGTGVVVGHVGPTRNAVLYALRAHQDELRRQAQRSADPESMLTLFKKFHEHVQELIGAPVEDSFPGEMPNVVAARLSNYFDLRGLNIAVDGGADSLAHAFELAGRYLEFGDVDLALVAGVNGNTLASWRDVLAGTGVPGLTGEGAFLFAVARRSYAEQENLPVLAEIDICSGEVA